MSDPVIVFKTKESARVEPAPLPPDRPRRRKALGLAPGVGPSEPIADEPAFVSGVPSVAAGLSAETLARAATMADVAEALDAAQRAPAPREGGRRRSRRPYRRIFQRTSCAQ
jgi:hypothetical protein